MLLKEPFYAHFLSGVVREVTNEVPTAAVGIRQGKISLLVNENFFLEELNSTSERVAVIKHETLHIIFKHLFRFNFKKNHQKIFNLAADIVVNQFIGNWNLPESAITLSTFPDLGLEPNKSVEWYYNKLNKLNEEIKNQDSDESNNTNISASISADNLKKLLNNQKTSHSDHSQWSNESQNNVSTRSLETELDRMIIQAKDRTSTKDYGSLPAGISSLISNIIKERKPKVNWKRALKIFSTNSRKTRIYHSMKRISKRYGTRPGIKIKRFQKMAVAIDTSGSIQIEQLSDFFNEIHGIWKQGAEIELIECDAKVQKTYNYDGNTPKLINGGGGTSFDPVFSYLRKNRFKKYDGCIYLTDGYASEPTIKPPCKLFWVITKNGKVGNHLKYGRVVQLN
jgi:predicted metal-dependent peptidase